MRFQSVLGKSPAATFRDALLQGIAPDGSLYIPEQIPHLQPSVVAELERFTLHQLGCDVISPFIDQISRDDLHGILQRAWDFPIPLVKLEEGLYLLELFHGPTLAFKDVGARFMAQVLSHFLEREHRRVSIAVATSGDTGGAVAHGFFDVPHITVFVLYPSGRISPLQEQQMTTLGGNIHALEVEGSFDDCQRLVKQALADRELIQSQNLTTANSINLGRLIPQIAYYVWAVAQLRQTGERSGQPLLVIPSGNVGNLTAAVYSKWMGNPIRGCLAAINANTVVADFFSSGSYVPRPSVQTYSNAMDVGNPSNFIRLQALYGYSLRFMKRDIFAVSISDEETLAEIRQTYERSAYILDPHSAVGVSAARKFITSASAQVPVIVAATAHPGKFPDVVERALGKRTPPPDALLRTMARPRVSTRIPAEYAALKKILLRLVV